ncbi:DUF6265 family protein [Chryseobacterium sp. 18068]|uniref:DUF6265 family protein n=1 Tax=Chryseobacterium sp. 18068 TaxID=2681414 RepID=UPI00135BF8C1|nr:DUF6265 family protein [Chryseobacterium sp. 18068]
MTKRIFFSMVASLLTLCTCTVKNQSNIKEIEWLVGTWEHKTSKGSIYETWRKADGNELVGKSYVIKNKDTILFESIRLVHEQCKLFYIPAVKDQNEGLQSVSREREFLEPIWCLKIKCTISHRSSLTKR